MATVSKRRRTARKGATPNLRKWPSRNFLAELEPELRESGHIEDLIGREPRLRALNAKVAALARRLRPGINSRDWLAYADARAFLRTAEFELAFNLGFENGLVLGRAERLAPPVPPRGHPHEDDPRHDLLRVLAGTTRPPEDAATRLLELALALLRGAPTAQT